ncbi:MAG: ABC transporter permease, partial [Acidimicrobiales bacterium]
NAMRNPRRTASAAAALMIGLGLVGTVTVLGSSVKKSSTEVFDRSLAADFAMSADSFMPTISPKMAEDLARRPEVGAVTELADGEWRLNGAGKNLMATTAGTVDRTLNVDMKSGEVAALGRGELLVEEKVAENNNWAVGDVVPMTFARTGTKDVRIGGTFGRNELLGNYLISLQTYDANFTDRLDFVVLTRTAAGTTADAARAAIAQVTADYPNVTARDQAEVKEENRKQVDQLLALVSVLLMLAIVIALFGIVNTLALSVLERTRELGLLRAVGMARRQVWTMIRTESIITSVMGAVLGLAIGVAFGWAIVQALSDEGIDSLVIPFATLLSYVILAALAGVFAALWPARKAAKLDVLQAISYE